MDSSRLEITALLLALQKSARIVEPLDRSSLEGYADRLGPKLIADAKREVERSWELGIETIGIHEAEFPELLGRAPQPPLVLFVKRGQGATFSGATGVSIVGSRKAQSSIEHFTAALGEEAATGGLVVVSGLAYGIDSAAHQGAIRGGKTWAVLAHGLDRVYPSIHRWLAEEILGHSGMLISEYPPETPPRPHQFLARNRIIAALSRVSIIVQAAARSGALATARFALEFGRELLAIPGPVWDESYAGSNGLLTDGASPLVRIEQIWDYFPDHERPVCPATEVEELSAELQRLLDAVKAEPELHLARIQELLPDQNIHRLVMELELMGRVELRPGNLVVLR
jgi:DNA processing protein